MDAQADIYKEEAFELLTELESSLLSLEKHPEDSNLIAKIFRAMHTIKGSGAMFGFDEVASFTHDIETVYDLVRNQTIRADKALIDLTLSACDQIRKMIENSEEIDRLNLEKQTAAFQKFLPAKEESLKPPEPTKPEADISETGRMSVYRIHFAPDQTIFSRGVRPSLLLQELQDLGHCDIIAQTDRIPPLESLDPEGCYTYWDMILSTDRGINAIRDVFIFVEDESQVNIEVVDEGQSKDALDYKKLGEILVEKGYIGRDDVAKVMSSHKKFGELLIDSGIVTPGKVQAALAEQQQVRNVREKRQSAESAATLRVPAQRLDTLVNLVGEMVTVQSRLSRIASVINHNDLISIAEEVDRLVTELRDNTMSIRMLPIGHIFSKFQRLVRDLSSDLGKEIDLVMEGEETELDKTVIEHLNDPLIHMIRNSIDHGIEEPSLRERTGKSRKGVIKLKAEHSGAHVLIHIEDDGAGMDPEAIRQKAVEKGLIHPDDRLTEKEYCNFIFAPGFSLAEKVTSLSGRGVGMDVVKRGIENLGGTLDIESKLHTGTRITLKLPLTLAIIDGLLVRIADAHFVLPLAAIEECVELSQEGIRKMHGRNVTQIRGELIPYVPLRDTFGLKGEPPPIELVIVNRIGNERIGVVVDQVIGQHQTVIKSMGKYYRSVKVISGATILGDGTVALILDIQRLLHMVEQQEAGRYSSRASIVL